MSEQERGVAAGWFGAILIVVLSGVTVALALEALLWK